MIVCMNIVKSYLYLLIFMIHDGMLYIDVHDGKNDLHVILFSLNDVFQFNHTIVLLFTIYVEHTPY